MSLDGGYPRAVTIPVPPSISRQEIGAFVSNEVVAILNELGTKAIHRRSVVLRFLSERLAILQFEEHAPIRLEEGQRERFELAKNSELAKISFREAIEDAKDQIDYAKIAVDNSVKRKLQGEPRETKTIPSAASNGSKQNKVA